MHKNTYISRLCSSDKGYHVVAEIVTILSIEIFSSAFDAGYIHELYFLNVLFVLKSTIVVVKFISFFFLGADTVVGKLTIL